MSHSENDLSCFDSYNCKQDVIIFLSLASMYDFSVV